MFQRRIEIPLRNLPSWRKTKEDSGQHRDQAGKHEHRQIDMCRRIFWGFPCNTKRPKHTHKRESKERSESAPPAPASSRLSGLANCAMILGARVAPNVDRIANFFGCRAAALREKREVPMFAHAIKS